MQSCCLKQAHVCRRASLQSAGICTACRPLSYISSTQTVSWYHPVSSCHHSPNSHQVHPVQSSSSSMHHSAISTQVFSCAHNPESWETRPCLKILWQPSVIPQCLTHMLVQAQQDSGSNVKILAHQSWKALFIIIIIITIIIVKIDSLLQMEGTAVTTSLCVMQPGINRPWTHCQSLQRPLLIRCRLVLHLRQMPSNKRSLRLLQRLQVVSLRAFCA